MHNALALAAHNVQYTIYNLLDTQYTVYTLQNTRYIVHNKQNVVHNRQLQNVARSTPENE